jgi:DNA-binding IclR family transcriptional regulator
VKAEPLAHDEHARSGAQSVERAIAILQCFTTGASERGISELATELQLGPSTVHRLVRALCDGGLLAQDASTERYHLGSTTVLLGQLAVEQFGFALARTELEALAEETGESVNLGVRQHDTVVTLLGAASREPLRVDQRPGTRVPVHASAMGKAILAFGATGLAETVAAVSSLERLTKNTITSRRRLTTELAVVRAKGFAVNDEERNVGVRAIAAPVLDHAGTARAAIAIQGPSVRMAQGRTEAIAQAAIATAGRVARLVPLELL